MKAMSALKALANDPKVDWLAQLDHHTQGVADAMEAIHGGRWNVSVSHETLLW